MAIHYSYVSSNLLGCLVYGYGFNLPIGAIKKPGVPEVRAGDLMHLRSDDDDVVYEFLVTRVRNFRDADEMRRHYSCDVVMPYDYHVGNTRGIPAYALRLKRTQTPIYRASEN